MSFDGCDRPVAAGLVCFFVDPSPYIIRLRHTSAVFLIRRAASISPVKPRFHCISRVPRGFTRAMT